MHPSDATPARGRRSAGIRAAAAVAAVIAVALAGHQVGSSLAHAQVWPQWSAADGRYDEATVDHGAAVDHGEAVLARAERLLEVAAGDLVSEETLLGPGRRFVHEFGHAVERQDYVAAENLWSSMNEDATAAESGTRVPSTIQLLLELRAQSGRLDLSRTVTDLPPEFERPQYVS